MNIFYEESGQFKVATIVQKNDSTYQVDTQHGKRTKVKANNVFVEFNEPMDSFLNAAQAEAADVARRPAAGMPAGSGFALRFDTACRHARA